MTQELTDLRNSILEGRYAEALFLVDELEWMSKKATLRNLKNFLIRILMYLIKNQIEQRLNNSWAAFIRDSLLEIQYLNLKENQTSYYIKQDEWETYLENGLKDAIFTASVEVSNGKLTPSQVEKMIDKNQIFNIANNLLNLTYFLPNTLRDVISEELSQLPGGKNWKLGKQN